MYPLDDVVAFDCEVYPNFFLVAFKRLKDGHVLNIQTTTKFSDSQREALENIMFKRVTFGFNSRNYDIPIILAALKGYTTEEIHKVSDYIINKRSQGWETINHFSLRRQYSWRTFDIQEPAPGVMVSLKLYGGRMHSQRLQDLPIAPGTVTTGPQRRELTQYCVNDLDTTIELYRAILPQIELRAKMSDAYRINLLSKSDAQIAEAVITKALPYTKRPTASHRDGLRYAAPDYIRFTSNTLTSALLDVEECRFGLNKGGSVELPPELKKRVIRIGRTDYKLGIGGLHSQEKKRAVVPTINQILVDRDVASYYPRIILNLELFPRHLRRKFLDVYGNIVTERLAAKAAGDKVTADALKIVVNGSFGKLGSKYSKLYSPGLMLAVTLTGQLSLLMLIERLDAAGIDVVSANTDGFVSLMDKDQYRRYDDICFDWELDTNFELEETRYKAVYSRDVNNYLAIGEDGKAKGKGIFSENPLMKNPVAPITLTAVRKFLLDGNPIETTIRNCEDVRQFVVVRTVRGGGVWRDEYLGKVARWVYTVDGEPIRYQSNGNKVATSDGAFPVMEFKGIPVGLDYDRYITMAKDILNDIGAGYEVRRR